MNLEIVECAGMSLGHALDEKPQQRSFVIHMHDNYELFLFVRGEADFLVEGNTYSLTSGALLLMRPAETHKLILRSDATYERYTFNFSEEALGKHAEDLLRFCKERPLGEKNRVLSKDFAIVSPLLIFRKMVADSAVIPPEASLAAGLTMLLGGVASATASSNVSAGQTFSAVASGENIRVLHFVNNHLCEPLTTEEMARSVGMSVSQFTRTFRALTGTSVHHYVRNKRLILAQERIAAGESVAAACLVSGFSDYSAFYRAYRKRFGASPTAAKPGRN